MTSAVVGDKVTKGFVVPHGAKVISEKCDFSKSL